MRDKRQRQTETDTKTDRQTYKDRQTGRWTDIDGQTATEEEGQRGRDKHTKKKRRLKETNKSLSETIRQPVSTQHTVLGQNVTAQVDRY